MSEPSGTPALPKTDRSGVPDPAANGVRLPDHKQLPCEDGEHARSMFEAPQSALLTETALSVLKRAYPDGHYCIGMDTGIYFEPTTPPLLGCRAPDWFLVPGVPRLLDGEIRRSYVQYLEQAEPLVILEYASE